MLIRIEPEQVNENWDVIGGGIRESIPSWVTMKFERMTKILTAIMLEKAICWAYYKDASMETPDLVMVTTVMEDPLTGTRALLIYSIYAFVQLQQGHWVEILDTLKKYCPVIDCESVVGFTDVPEIIKLIKVLDGKINLAFFEFGL